MNNEIILEDKKILVKQNKKTAYGGGGAGKCIGVRLTKYSPDEFIVEPLNTRGTAAFFQIRLNNEIIPQLIAALKIVQYDSNNQSEEGS